MSANEEMTGTVEAIEQEEPTGELPMRSVPVVVEGLVQVQHVPSRASSSRSFTVSDADPFKIAKQDPRRRHLMLVSTAAFWVDFGTNGQAGTLQSVCALWPANVPMPVTHQDEVWVRSDAGDITVSAVAENWAD